MRGRHQWSLVIYTALAWLGQPDTDSAIDQWGGMKTTPNRPTFTRPLSWYGWGRGVLLRETRPPVSCPACLTLWPDLAIEGRGHFLLTIAWYWSQYFSLCWKFFTPQKALKASRQKERETFGKQYDLEDSLLSEGKDKKLSYWIKCLFMILYLYRQLAKEHNSFSLRILLSSEQNNKKQINKAFLINIPRCKW